jgi:hypothetical protein
LRCDLDNNFSIAPSSVTPRRPHSRRWSNWLWQ